MAEALHRLLERNARKYPDKTAVRYPKDDLTWTWRDLNDRANAAAAALTGVGVRPGDRVALLIPNRPAFVQAYFGTLKAGGVVVPINVRLTPGEASYILQDAQARVLIADPTLRDTAEKTAAGTGVERVLSTDDLDIAGPAADPDGPSSLDALAEILYTSGTTGRPKGVELTHNAVHSVASMMAYEMDIRKDDRVLILMPLTHSAPTSRCWAPSIAVRPACWATLPRPRCWTTRRRKVRRTSSAPLWPTCWAPNCWRSPPATCPGPSAGSTAARRRHPAQRLRQDPQARTAREHSLTTSGSPCYRARRHLGVPLETRRVSKGTGCAT
ncbi:MAG: class I adenylate-forming enzyme family protein [Bacillota bacterium]